VTFLPCFVWIFAGAPFVERLRGNAALASALGAITAAVVGVILNLAIWFALHLLFARVETVCVWRLHMDAPVFASLDLPATGLSLLAVIWLFVLKRGVFETLAVAAAGGLVLKLALA
ncbi:MAG: chromate transporter, partial [Sphingomonas sp.]